LVAFNTLWSLSHIATIATYGGLQFLGISVIGIIDYYELRRQSVAVEQLFAIGRLGHYWFWGGVNWVAVVVIAAGIVAYLNFYGPISLGATAKFRYFGASVPVVVVSANNAVARPALTRGPTSTRDADRQAPLCCAPRGHPVGTRGRYFRTVRGGETCSPSFIHSSFAIRS
jgi:hypothetical protein